MEEMIRTLYVDDSPFPGVVSDALTRADDCRIAETASSATEGLEYCSEADTDCIVSEYDLTGMNGLEFLRTIRSDYPDLPFILCTAVGSEAVASRAISAGVTDYFQKEHVRDHPERLIRRIRSAVTQHSTDQIAEEEQLLLKEGLDTLDGLVYIIRPDGTPQFWNERVSELAACSDDQISDMDVADFFPADERDQIASAIETVLSTGEATVEADIFDQVGERIPYEFTGRRLVCERVVRNRRDPGLPKGRGYRPVETRTPCEGGHETDTSTDATRDMEEETEEEWVHRMRRLRSEWPRRLFDDE